MRVGLIPLFGWMPHSEHFVYLAHAIRALGHEVEVLTCDGSIPTCFNVEIKRQKKPIVCAACKSSTAVVAFQADEKNRFRKYTSSPTSSEVPNEWIHSSLRSLHRIEGDEMLPSLLLQSQAVKLAEATSQVYHRVQEWVDDRRPDFVFFFNGRIDISRAVLEALREKKIPFASVERSFSGNGINVLPGEDCLGLQAVHKLTSLVRDIPLPADKSYAAGQFLHDRIIGQTKTEWRNYNADSEDGEWPLLADGPRVLILPSSMNEIQGSSDYSMEWQDPTEGFEAVINGFGISPRQVLVRGHPNWAMDIGTAKGSAISQHYLNWSTSQGYHYIPSEVKVRSVDLMRDSDLVLVSHSSAAFEAAAVRRHVIAVGGAHYSKAGFTHDASDSEKLSRIIKNLKLYRGITLDKRRQRRLLRYISAAMTNIPMFAEDIVPLDARHCKMYKASNFNRLKSILDGGSLSLEIEHHDGCERIEDQVLEKIGTAEWIDIIAKRSGNASSNKWPIYRGQLLFKISSALR